MPQRSKELDDSLSMHHWFGVEVRNWRRVRDLKLPALGAKVGVSGDLIGKIEKADRKCPRALVAPLDDALGAGGALVRLWRRVEEADARDRADADNRQTADADSEAVQPKATDRRKPEAGMLVPDPPAQLDRSLPPVLRRNLLAVGGIAALTAGSWSDLIPAPGRTPLPSSVRREDIAQVREASAALAKWDNLYGGGGIVREASIGELQWATNLLDVPCPDALRADLFSAVGRLSIVMGASAFDAHAHDDARRLLAFGTVCAEEGDDWHLRAASLNWRARQEIWTGSPDAGLTYAENGLVRADRLTYREQATLHNARARALARMGRRDEALAAIGRSDTVFSKSKPGQDSPWMAFYDNAQHHGDTGHALYDLALKGLHTPRPAVERLRTAINGHAPGFARSRAFSRTKLSSLTMITGDPQEAVAIANRALDEVGRLRSRRAAQDLRELLQHSSHHSKQPDVTELRHRITTALA
ncbi:helix-turn-helix transcriptional regulator [Streptomyces sp. NPDC046215]|uniref:Helix-turn-helix transcriptional regulator n=1 Tax=Streptomyces stramineus TaxID=173861 RepID=A0ABN1AMS6_9ACTN